jgi:glycosyltransferase involved in cell wall biosynthesis
MNTSWKGFALVADWVARSAGTGIQWRFYGQPDEAVQRACTALRNSRNESVCFAGRKPAVEIFNEVDVLVHASTEFDPFPTVLLEAARAGIPAIASSLGGGPEIVEHGVTGYVFDPSAAEIGLSHLHSLAASRSLRETVGQAARARYEEQFTIARMTRGYSEFWKSARR